uniref:L1 transposable element RRM domain-containing protein n=1 Tax=Poecilia formosa TaxID=48698 RepID=A0A087X489_POEFO
TGSEMLMLTELCKFREESGVAQRDILEYQTRMEASIGEIKKRIDTQERVLAYLLKKDARLTAKLNDIENRMHRNNIRLYGIKEDSEGKEMIPFITDFFKSALKLPEGTDICIERAHRATAPKPKPATPPRSITVHFLDFNVKQMVLQHAWKQRDVEFWGKNVYFDQDYSTEVQRKRKQVREVTKKLKERNIKAQSPYPAQLRLFLDKGVKTFSSLLEAQSTLKELGIPVEVDERDILERELLRNNWQTRG